LKARQQQLAGQGAILATAFFWSTSGLFIKLLNWHPIVIASMRSLVAALFLIIIRLIFPPPKGVKNEPFPLWAGAFSYALTMLLFVTANKITTSANAILLQYGAPVWAALLGWYLIKEKPRWEHWGALVLVMGGLVLFFRDDLGSGALMGDGIAALSGVFFAGHSVFLRMLKDGNPRDCLLLAHVITAVLGIPFMILYPPVFSVSSALSITYMGTIQIGIAAILFSYGIKRISAVQAMLTATAEPILNPLWVLLITGEKPSLGAIAGGSIILLAVVSSSLVGMRRQKLPGQRLPGQRLPRQSLRRQNE